MQRLGFAHTGDAGVVDEDLDRSEAVVHRHQQVLHLVGVGQVGGEDRPGDADLVERLFGPGLVEVDQAQAGPGLTQQAGDRPAQAGCRSGDQRRLPVEFPAHPPSPLLRW